MNNRKQKPRPPSRSWISRLAQALLGDALEREDLLQILQLAARRQLIARDELDMIQGVFQVSQMQVRDIMVPRSQMAVLERDMAPEDYLPVMNKHGYSRYPVISEDRDDVIGILLAKDLLRYFDSSQTERFVLKDVLREAVFVPESKRLNVLLTDFRTNRNHMAIVMNEYGGVAGLVTIEDVLEQIVGEIQDEHDYDEDDSMIRQVRGSHVVKALTPIEDFNEYFDCQLSEGDLDTVGGLVVNALGYLPERGETVVIGDLEFEVLHSDSRRINLLRVSPAISPGDEAEDKQ